jgi:hypothetical protein
MCGGKPENNFFIKKSGGFVVTKRLVSAIYIVSDVERDGNASTVLDTIG